MGAFFEYEDRGMIGALADKLEHGPLQLFCVSSVDSESWYYKRSIRATASPASAIRGLHPQRVVPLIHHLTHHDGDRRHRLQLRRLSRHGARAAPSLHLHVVRDDGRRVRHHAVPRRLLRRGLLLPESAVVPAEPGRPVLSRSVPPEQVGAGDRRARHLPRRPTSSSRRCCTPRASRTACTSGTGRSTTGRTGGRWPPPYLP